MSNATIERSELCTEISTPAQSKLGHLRFSQDPMIFRQQRAESESIWKSKPLRWLIGGAIIGGLLGGVKGAMFLGIGTAGLSWINENVLNRKQQ